MPVTDTLTKPPSCLYSIPDVMNKTTLSRGGVNLLIRRGQLRAVKIGKRTCVRSADFEAFVDGLTEV